jgi:hypothetical protein
MLQNFSTKFLAYFIVGGMTLILPVVLLLSKGVLPEVFTGKFSVFFFIIASVVFGRTLIHVHWKYIKK